MAINISVLLGVGIAAVLAANPCSVNPYTPAIVATIISAIFCTAFIMLLVLFLYNHHLQELILQGEYD
ncbi:hypothetical protein FOZ71_06845 [Weissella cibaria]|uniref:hypothetical protein n=1 Tax=Weissella cibaria TaxID=137591 RepID=UPI0011959BFB|nr:hypothetical protein [Weissella cibaria]TVV29834.1 hypothetical protein FOZ71_06845 [Weissella cibaria]